jgi:hypothetical protein
VKQTDERGYTTSEWLAANGISPPPWPEGSDELRAFEWAVSERDEPGPAILRLLAEIEWRRTEWADTMGREFSDVIAENKRLQAELRRAAEGTPGKAATRRAARGSGSTRRT